MSLGLAQLRNSRLLWVVPVVLLVTIGATGVFALTLPDTYTARAIVQVSPQSTENGGIVGNLTVSSAAAGYVAYLGSPVTLNSVAETVGLPYSELKAGLDIRLLPATTTIAVEYESQRAADAAAGANAIAAQGLSRSVNDPVATLAILSSATPPGSPSGPARTLILIAGTALGVLLAGAAAALLSTRSPRTQAAEQIVYAEPAIQREPEVVS